MYVLETHCLWVLDLVPDVIYSHMLVLGLEACSPKWKFGDITMRLPKEGAFPQRQNFIGSHGLLQVVWGLFCEI